MPLDVLTRPSVADPPHDDARLPSPREAEPIAARTWIAAVFIALYLLLTVLPLQLLHLVAGRLSPRRQHNSNTPRPVSLEAPLLD